VRNQLARYKTQTFTWTKFEETRPTVVPLPVQGLLSHMAVTRSRYEGSRISTPARSDPCTQQKIDVLAFKSDTRYCVFSSGCNSSQVDARAFQNIQHHVCGVRCTDVPNC
jgi:hypothetical protein